MTHIDAVVVNHNTSLYAMLAVSSLFEQALPAGQTLTLHVIDNHSTDGHVESLAALVTRRGGSFTLSRWPVGSHSVTTHGDALRDFVLTMRDADFLLMLDPDVELLGNEVLASLLRCLEGDPQAWAAGPVLRDPLGRADQDPGSTVRVGIRREVAPGVERDFVWSAKRRDRCHPAFALIRNSELFRNVTEHLGLNTAYVISADPDVGGFYETMGLASHVMNCNGNRWAIADAEVMHMGASSYATKNRGLRQRHAAQRLSHYGIDVSLSVDP